MVIPTIETLRLRLRPWRLEDLSPFAALNADPAVMKYFTKPLNRTETKSYIEQLVAHFHQHGFGRWAVEVKDGGQFIGAVGLSVPPWPTSFTPCVDVGWRLASDQWGRGYAGEAAQAALRHGFNVLGLPEIVSFTTEANERSRALMERLGMCRSEADDFDCPGIPPNHPWRRYVLYRMDRSRWKPRPVDSPSGGAPA